MPNKQNVQEAAATATTGEEITTVGEALTLISQYAAFEAKYIDDEELAKEYFQGRKATLIYNFGTETYTLVSTIPNMQEAVIWAANQVRAREA